MSPSKDTPNFPWFLSNVSIERSTSYTLAVLSKLHVATKEECGSNVTPHISLSWPTSLATHSPEGMSQMLAVLSNEPVTILSPNGLLNARAYTTLRCPKKDLSSVAF